MQLTLHFVKETSCRHYWKISVKLYLLVIKEMQCLMLFVELFSFITDFVNECKYCNVFFYVFRQCRETLTFSAKVIWRSNWTMHLHKTINQLIKNTLVLLFSEIAILLLLRYPILILNNEL